MSSNVNCGLCSFVWPQLNHLAIFQFAQDRNHALWPVIYRAFSIFVFPSHASTPPFFFGIFVVSHMRIYFSVYKSAYRQDISDVSLVFDASPERGAAAVHTTRCSAGVRQAYRSLSHSLYIQMICTVTHTVVVRMFLPASSCKQAPCKVRLSEQVTVASARSGYPVFVCPGLDVWGDLVRSHTPAPSYCQLDLPAVSYHIPG